MNVTLQPSFSVDGKIFLDGSMDLLSSFVCLSLYPLLTVLAWLSPVWSIGGFDSCVHISEEASNASTAVPWAIAAAIITAGILGWLCVIVIAACMGTDIPSILASPYGQPMATIYAMRLGKQGTLAIWSCMFLIQFAMGLSILLSCSRQMWAFSRDHALPFSSILRKVTKKAVPVYAVWGAVLCSLLLGNFSLGIGLILGLLAIINVATAQAVFAIAVLGTYAAYVRIDYEWANLPGNPNFLSDGMGK
jgi:amino acid transporter